jgi:hypothetical protein
MRLPDAFEQIIRKVSVLPGLGFLQNYVREFYSRTGEVTAKARRYQGYVSTARSAGEDVVRATRKEAEDEDEDEDLEEEEDDFETFMQ